MRKHRAKFEKRGLLAMRADLWGLLFDVDEPEEKVDLRGNVAVVKIEGPLTHHSEWWWDSYDAIKERVSDALASTADTVVLRIDSPGGDVSGCFETVREIRAMAARSGKRIVSFADGMAASAGYALACAASEIHLPATGFVGSIGVISTLFDWVGMNQKLGFNVAVVASGERKRYGHPDVPISDAAVANAQGQVDQLAELFFELVAESRTGLTTEAVSAMQAGLVIGNDAVTAKLADSVTTFDDLLEMLSSSEHTPPRAGGNMAWKDDMKKAADEGDEEAKKCLEALDGDGDNDGDKPKEGAEEPKKDDEDKAKSESEKDDKSAEEPKKDDEDKAAARTFEQRLAAIEERGERERLIASRPDMPAAMRSKLASASLDVVRWTVGNLPPVAAPPAKGKSASLTPTSPAAHAGAIVPETTRAREQGANALGVTRRSDRADELDEALGFVKPKGYVVHNRNTTSIGVMTPAQAREHRKAFEARQEAERQAKAAAHSNGGK